MDRHTVKLNLVVDRAASLKLRGWWFKKFEPEIFRSKPFQIARIDEKIERLGHRLPHDLRAFEDMAFPASARTGIATTKHQTAAPNIASCAGDRAQCTV